MSHFTKSLLDVLEETGGEVKNVDLIERVNLIFEKHNLIQRVGLKKMVCLFPIAIKASPLS
jgi:hypothetical protein